jgi:hypothetical protein
VAANNASKVWCAPSEEDGRWLLATNSAVVGVGQTVATSGVVQYEQIAGGITRDSMWDSFTVLPNTPASLEVRTVLLNHITIKQLCKWGWDESGGEGGMSADIMKQGWTSKEYMGTTFIITIKKTLVGDNTFYHYADPAFLGKSFSLEEPRAPETVNPMKPRSMQTSA